LKIYYINLDRQPERRLRLERQLSELGLEATRIRAVEPADIPPEVLQRYCHQRTPHFLAPAELACTLSHVEAFKRIAAGIAPFGLVLEDDAILSRSLPAFLAAFAGAPPPLDIVKLDALRERVLVAAGAPATISGISLLEVVGTRGCCGGYLISREAAARLAADPSLLNAPIDVSLYFPYENIAKGLAIRHADPALCTQYVGPGTDSSLDAPRSAMRQVRRHWRNIILRTIRKRRPQLHDFIQRVLGAKVVRTRVVDDLVVPYAPARPQVGQQAM
jgi:glycosyl transferase family 25